ncbi:MAG: hypothetical protein WEC59_01185 [Salibacteraceae bacterium]
MSFLDDGFYSKEEAIKIANCALAHPSTKEEDTALLVYSLHALNHKLNAVKTAFPQYWKHAVAIKSNPLLAILSHVSSKGFGLEAASYEEVALAIQSRNDFIVWDSPVKTQSELNHVSALNSNLIINANGLLEIQRLMDADIYSEKKNIQIGLRINPQISSSALTSMNVSGVYSKFGEPISNERNIKKVIRKSKRPIGIHIHASSQNTAIQETVRAIKKVYQLADDIGWKHLSYFDIGGGYPVNYGFESVPAINDYAEQLQAECPKLFDGSIEVYTEFGRYYHANCGLSISRIHDVKSLPNHQTIIQHLGADMFLRESYEVDKWPHRMLVYSTKKQQTNQINSDVAGPLCFGGDYIARSINLPEAAEGDYIIVLDAGANSIALWSKHCSRRVPKIIGIDENEQAFLIKERQSTGEAIAFWS